MNSAGNLAVGAGDRLYYVFSDNRRHAGEFPFPTRVGPRAAGYPCPAGKRTDTDVYIVWSTNGGTTWSAPVRVNQDDLGNDRDQWYPWVGAWDNRVDVVFHDRRDDAANKLAHSYLARSWDGGATWTDFGVSEFLSNFDNAFFGVGTFIGDYNNLAITFWGRTYAVFTCVVPGKADSDICWAIIDP